MIKYKYDVIVKTTGIEVKFDGVKILETTDTTFTSGYIALSARESPATINAYYDDFFIRKYIDPEPSHGDWGPEESTLKPYDLN